MLAHNDNDALDWADDIFVASRAVDRRLLAKAWQPDHIAD